MKHRVILLLGMAIGVTNAKAAIFCPPDKTISCYDDIHALNLTGMPTLIGYPAELARYQDAGPNGNCNAGTINRTWYIDLNQNNQLDTGEHACIQKITVQYIGAPVIVTFPPDRQYSCTEDIVVESPEWTSGACDMIGVSRTDQVYTAGGEACFKILRTFTVISWCTYLPGTPGWNGEGIWTHTQIIKVVEDSKPVITSCAPVIISTDAGCEGTFTIRNSADDPGQCGRQSLLWAAQIDLWSDGTIDYTYGFNQPGQFRLDTVANKKEISITLPGKVRMGTHKVVWKVRDVCGNNTSCIQYVQMKDTKRPTPYLHDVLSASFDARSMNLMVPARIFNIQSTDNCTLPGNLRFSFSKDVNDTLRIISCANAGFQYYTVYVTDMMGNQEYADVFLLAFDNGTCNSILTLTGTVAESNGTPLPGLGVTLRHPAMQLQYPVTSDGLGRLSWTQIPLYKDMVVHLSGAVSLPADEWEKRVNILDLKMLQDHVMGRRRLNQFEWMAADIDGDGRIRARDVSLLRHALLHPEKQKTPFVYAVDQDSIFGEEDLSRVKTSLSLGASDGRLDITAVCSGDISGANQLRAEPRSSIMLDEVRDGEWVHYTAQNEMHSEGWQLSIDLPVGSEVPSVMSTAYPVERYPICYEPETGRLRWLALGTANWQKGAILFSVNIPKGERWQGRLRPSLSALLLPDYRLGGLASSPESRNTSAADITVTPNPGDGRFQLQCGDCSLLSVHDISGRAIPWQWQGTDILLDAPAGVYSLRIQTRNGVRSTRLIIADQ